MGEEILNYAFKHNKNVRIDTHEDNIPMQNLLTRHGFKHVGTIILKMVNQDGHIIGVRIVIFHNFR